MIVMMTSAGHETGPAVARNGVADDDAKIGDEMRHPANF